MTRIRGINPQLLMRVLSAAVVSLAVTTVLVAVLEDRLGVPNASSVYLLAVVAVAVLHGEVAAAGTAIGAFLLYDFLFVEPRFNLTVSDPGEWLTPHRASVYRDAPGRRRKESVHLPASLG